jgi:hypothetical protein
MQFQNSIQNLTTQTTSLVVADTDTVIKKIAITNVDYSGAVDYPVSADQTQTITNYFGAIGRNTNTSYPYGTIFDARYIDDNFTFVIVPYSDTIQGGYSTDLYNNTQNANLYLQAVKKNSDGTYTTGSPVSLGFSANNAIANNSFDTNYFVDVEKISDNTFIACNSYGSDAKLLTFDPATLTFTLVGTVNFGYPSTAKILPTGEANKILIFDNNQTNNSSAASNSLYYRAATIDPTTYAITYVSAPILVSSGFFYNGTTDIRINGVKATKNANEYVIAGRGSSGYHRFVHCSFNTTTNTLTVDRDYQKTGYTVSTSSSGISLLSLSTGDDFHFIGASTVADNYQYSSWFESSSKTVDASQTALPIYSTTYWINSPTLYRLNATTALLIGNKNIDSGYSGLFYRVKNTSTGTSWSSLNYSYANSSPWYWSSGNASFTLGDGRVYVNQHIFSTDGSGYSLYYGAVFVNNTLTGITTATIPPTIGLYDKRFVSSNGVYTAVLQPNGRVISVFKNGVIYKTYAISTSYYIFSIQINANGDLVALSGHSIAQFTRNSNSTIYYFCQNVEIAASGTYNLTGFSIGGSYYSSNTGTAYLDGTVLYLLTTRFDDSSTYYGYLWSVDVNGSAGTLTVKEYINTYSAGGASSIYFTSPTIMKINGVLYAQFYNGSGICCAFTRSITQTTPWLNYPYQNIFAYDNDTNIFKQSPQTLYYKHKADFTNVSTGINSQTFDIKPYSPVSGFYASYYGGNINVYNSAYTLLTSIAVDKNLGYKRFVKSGVVYDFEYYGNIGTSIYVSGNIVAANGKKLNIFSGLEVKYTETKTTLEQLLLGVGEKLEVTTSYRYSPLVRIESIKA